MASGQSVFSQSFLFALSVVLLSSLGASGAETVSPASTPVAPEARDGIGDSTLQNAGPLTPVTKKRKRPDQEYSQADYEERRDKFRRMQENGYHLILGGIGAGVGGLALMVYGINQLERRQSMDRYGNDTSGDEGVIPFFVGYISLVAVFPTLLTTGIILNRVGNHRRERYESLLEEAGSHTQLYIGVNSLRLTYSF